jgi:MFS transporter, DHA2 family, multidrug resistance protein
VALGLGCLQIVLDKGQEDDWFGSSFIVVFTGLSVLALVALIFWELWVAKTPVVDLTLFKNASFAFTNVMMFALGFVLLASTQLLPQFVQQLLGYNATKAGLILMPGGFLIMALMPLVGFLVRKVQPKYLVMFGFIGSWAALMYLSRYDTEVSFRVLVIGRMLQAAGLAFLFVPINTLAFGNLPPGKTNAASAMINLMRNLGGSVGISVATTLLARRSQAHQTFLASHLTPTSPGFQERLQAIAHRFMLMGQSSVDATHGAMAALGRQVEVQALMLSYLDVFRVLMVACVVALVLTVFLKRVDLKKVEAGA